MGAFVPFSPVFRSTFRSYFPVTSSTPQQFLRFYSAPVHMNVEPEQQVAVEKKDTEKKQELTRTAAIIPPPSSLTRWNWPNTRLSMLDSFFQDSFFDSALTPINRMLAEMDTTQRSMMADRDTQALLGWSPHWDIRETDSAYELQVEIPGVKPADVKVELKDDILTIRGEKMDDIKEEAKEGQGWIRRETFRGAFQKSMRLPKNIDRDSISAVNKHGVLKLHIKKSEEDPKLVTIPVEEEK